MHKTIVEASEAGLPPGRWPPVLEWEGVAYRRLRMVGDAWVYVAGNGDMLHILND